MAIFDKIGEIAKIAANKTEEITKTIGEKAEAAMEIQKLTSLVSKEENHRRKSRSRYGDPETYLAGKQRRKQN